MRRPCIEPGCSQLAKQGEARCPTHLQQQGRAKNERRASRAHPSKGAGALMRRAINRAGIGVCAHCRGTHSARAIEIDHVLPLEDGGLDEPANLQPLCHGCHAIKTQAENRARLAARR